MSTPGLQRTLVLLKPDTVRRGLAGEVLARFEAKGLRLVAMDLRRADAETADRHYAEHVGKEFYPALRDFVIGGPLVAMVLEGYEAVKAARQVIGATNPLEAATGSIRGDFALEVGQNMVHGSDSNESAAREAKLFFPEL